MKPFTERTITIIKQIPEGHIMTYGQVARTAGNPRAARQVSRILHSMSSTYHLPWHRVVNAQGRIAFQDEEKAAVQRNLLEDEGVLVLHNKVSLETYQYVNHEPYESI